MHNRRETWAKDVADIFSRLVHPPPAIEAGGSWRYGKRGSLALAVEAATAAEAGREYGNACGLRVKARGAVTRCGAWPRLWESIKAARPSLVIVDPVSAALADADTSQTGAARAGKAGVSWKHGAVPASSRGGLTPGRSCPGLIEGFSTALF